MNFFCSILALRVKELSPVPALTDEDVKADPCTFEGW